VLDVKLKKIIRDIIRTSFEVWVVRGAFNWDCALCACKLELDSDLNSEETSRNVVMKVPDTLLVNFPLLS
jgi:hypothetical protein